MKIRIKGNSIRLRLSQVEVTELQLNGRVEESITFSPSTKLVYCLELSAFAVAIEAKYEANRITVVIPEATAYPWCQTDQVGVENRQRIDAEGAELAILIEKDFRCLTDRPGEDESDLYPHPKENSTNC
ncbi:MAG: hypothetical protein AAF990_08155 [Bacteroidota bacterium]